MTYISIHAPREGSDRDVHTNRLKRIPFQSTLPVRGATKYGKVVSIFEIYFNPRSP